MGGGDGQKEGQEIRQQNETDSLFSKDTLSGELVGQEVRLEGGIFQSVIQKVAAIFVNDKVQGWTMRVCG